MIIGQLLDAVADFGLRIAQVRQSTTSAVFGSICMAASVSCKNVKNKALSWVVNL